MVDDEFSQQRLTPRLPLSWQCSTTHSPRTCFSSFVHAVFLNLCSQNPVVMLEIICRRITSFVANKSCFSLRFHSLQMDHDRMLKRTKLAPCNRALHDCCHAICQGLKCDISERGYQPTHCFNKSLQNPIRKFTLLKYMRESFICIATQINSNHSLVLHDFVVYPLQEVCATSPSIVTQRLWGCCQPKFPLPCKETSKLAA